MSVVEGGGSSGGLRESLACLREQHAIITRACYTLAGSLRTGAVDEGLQAAERICATLLMTDELIGFITRTDAPGAVLGEVQRLREGMLREVAPWLAAAVRDLPGAEALVRMFLFAHPGTRDTDRLARRGGGGDRA